MGDRRRALSVAAVAWTLATIVGLWAPPPPAPRFDLPWLDKAVHFGSFFVGAGLWTFARATAQAVLAGAIVLAAVTEIGQGILPWARHPDVGDALFDLLGAMLGLVSAHAILVWRGREP